MGAKERDFFARNAGETLEGTPHRSSLCVRVVAVAWVPTRCRSSVRRLSPGSDLALRNQIQGLIHISCNPYHVSSCLIEFYFALLPELLDRSRGKNTVVSPDARIWRSALFPGLDWLSRSTATWTW